MSQMEIYFNYEGMRAHVKELEEIKQALELLKVSIIREPEQTSASILSEVEKSILAISELIHLSLKCIQNYEAVEYENIQIVNKLPTWAYFLERELQKKQNYTIEQSITKAFKICKTVAPAPIRSSILMGGNHSKERVPVAPWLQERI